MQRAVLQAYQSLKNQNVNVNASLTSKNKPSILDEPGLHHGDRVSVVRNPLEVGFILTLRCHEVQGPYTLGLKDKLFYRVRTYRGGHNVVLFSLESPRER